MVEGAALSAREEILGKVRAAVAARDDAPPPGTPIGPASLAPEAARARLHERLLEFGADVRTATASTLPDTLREACGAGTVIVPADWPIEWKPAGLEVEREGDQDPRTLARFDCALTGARLGVAESGTLVFDGGSLQGSRLLTLLVELHVCVLRTSDVVDSLDAAMDRIRPDAGTPGALTFVSGPSATTDIELTRIEGVHGPRRLAVVLLDG